MFFKSLLTHESRLLLSRGRSRGTKIWNNEVQKENYKRNRYGDDDGPFDDAGLYLFYAKKKKKKDRWISISASNVRLIFQLAWLPVTLSSIKLSLIRSLFVGKIALAIMLYNTLRNSKKSETIVIHKPEYHQHYYETYHEPEEDDGGWWGRGTRWHFFK